MSEFSSGIKKPNNEINKSSKVVHIDYFAKIIQSTKEFKEKNHTLSHANTYNPLLFLVFKNKYFSMTYEHIFI